jgi:protein SCO1/2
MFRMSVILSLSSLLLSAQSGRCAEGKTSAAPNTNQHIYQVKGLVLEVHPEEKSVKIKHEEIPGYMIAMTMPFDVKDTNELAGIGPGDPVSFRLIVTDTDGWIDQIRRTGPKTNDLPVTPYLKFVRDFEPLNVGDPIPEYHFTNQFGQAFSTAQFKGQALAINFIFTRCPFPTFCPQTARNFSEVQSKLLARADGPTNWHLMTVSFDPEFDKPDVLKAYSQNYQANPDRWTFATGSVADITALGSKFGLTFWRDETGSISHNLRTLVIDASGCVQNIITGNEWTPDELVAELVKAAAAKR